MDKDEAIFSAITVTPALQFPCARYRRKPLVAPKYVINPQVAHSADVADHTTPGKYCIHCAEIGKDS